MATAKKVTKTPAKAPAPAPKKTPAKKAAPTKAPAPTKAAPKEQMVLYTFRLEPSIIEKLTAQGGKLGCTHAEIARRAIREYFDGRVAKKTA